MNKSASSIVKKIMLTSMSTIMLFGYLLPSQVYAETTDAVEEEKAVNQEEPDESGATKDEINVVESTDDVEQASKEIEKVEATEVKEDSAQKSDEIVEEEQVVETVAEPLVPEKIDLEIDFTSFEEVRGAFQAFLDNIADYSDSEILGYVKGFEITNDANFGIMSNLEVFDVNQFNQDQLTILIEFIKEHQEEVNNLNFASEADIYSSGDTQTTQSLQAFESLVRTNSSTTNSVTRLSGATRFQTAVDISKNGWNNSPTVIIANSHQFADALAGVPLAIETNSPILLVPSNAVPQATLNEINRLGSVRAIILGGANAVSKNVENTLKNNGLSVKRYAGVNRYATAEAIANEMVRRTGSKEAFLVSGEDFADAMSVAAIAGRRGAPIYLTRSYTLSGQARKAASKIRNWTVVGGTNAISNTVYGTLASNGGSNRVRLAGDTRYETNIAVLNHFGISTNKAYVATGTDFVDALTGSVLAGVRDSGVLLVKESDDVLTATLDYGDKKNVSSYTLFGGVNVLSSKVAEIFKYNRLSGKKPLVVIDPGHGGKFIGTASLSGIAEKTVTLQSSKYIRNYLVSSGNYEVVMTRNTDKHFSTNLSKDLTYRANMANELDADIFISVHYNGGTPGSNGLETFVHHPTYPAQAKRSALNISDPRIKSSRDLADSVQNLMVQRIGLYNRGVKGLNLAVLRQTEMPAVLVELGFMQSSIDSKVILSDSYRQKSAKAIKDGVDRYFGF